MSVELGIPCLMARIQKNQAFWDVTFCLLPFKYYDLLMNLENQFGDILGEFKILFNGNFWILVNKYVLIR